MEDANKTKITVVGTGYVGTSMASILSINFSVICLDIDDDRINKINNKISPIEDDDIQALMNTSKLNLRATSDKAKAYHDAKFIIIAVPTNFDEKKNSFDTSVVEKVIEDAIFFNSKAVIVIKSTVPIGFTEFCKEKYNYKRIIFSPEFLREGCALYDNYYPSRIIVGSTKEHGIEFSKILKNAAKNTSIPVLLTTSEEAEAIKLFSNSYLAMRISFFNELDSFSIANNLNTKNIIDGVCLDKRIGKDYNNPSFGYGGYCLPKDTKQLLTSFKEVPQSIIKSIVDSNIVRKSYLIEKIAEKKPKTVGIYRLNMKSGSDNIKFSSVLDIIDGIVAKGIELIIYEPLMEKVTTFNGINLISDMEAFKEKSDIILANRISSDIEDIKDKVFTRDIYGVN